MAIKNFKKQFDQLAKKMYKRPLSKFPSNRVINPKQENVSSITTRSRKTLSEVENKVAQKRLKKRMRKKVKKES